jgi:hypothetical protein
MKKTILIATAMAVSLAGATGVSAWAQDSREAEIIGLHQLCDRGDRKACVRFGMMIQQNKDHMREWHRVHPEWFWWER